MLPPAILAELRAAVDSNGRSGSTSQSGLITAPNQLQTYECDGLTAFRVTPAAVVLPRTTEQVQSVVRICAKHKIPFVARGSGTGLSGGALPAEGSVVICLSRMNRILNIDLPNQQITVQPGVINANVTAAVSRDGFFYAPDPSSQSVCSIGGNIAENAGGAHCLKYGFTVTHVLEMTVVLPTGEVVTLGSKTPDTPGYDLLGVFIGSEGTLGVATEMTLRIVRKPETVQVILAAFDTIAAAAQTVSDVIAAGQLPAAMEIMDRLSIEAAEASVHPNYPACEALLLIELDGPARRSRPSDGHRHLARKEKRRMGDAPRHRRTGPLLNMEGPQSRLRRGRPPLFALYRAGRRHPAHGTSRSSRKDNRDVRRRKPSRHKCLSRR